MPLSPFKRTLEQKLVDTLTSRSNAWKSTLTSNNSMHMRQSVKPTIFLELVGEGGYKLPLNDINYNKTYSKFKLAPLIKSITVTQGGNYGLTMEMEAEIQCHDRYTFEEVEKAFLRMSNEVKCSWGYVKSASPGYNQVVELDKFIVCGYQFNTTDEGFWIAKFKAVSSAQGILGFNITVSPIKTPSNMQYILNGEKKPVQGLSEIFIYHAQQNGEVALDAIKEETGIILSIDDKVGKGNILIRDLSFMKTDASGWSILGVDLYSGYKGVVSWWEGPSYHTYYTLEYIVNAFNRAIKSVYVELSKSTKSGKLMADLEIDFDDEMSKSYIDTHIQSAYPLDILIIGNGLGDYNTDDLGVNFEEMPNVNLVTAVEGVDPKHTHRHIIDIKKILVEQSIVFSALNSATEDKSEAESNAGKKSDNKEITLNAFFNTIFERIGSATGGAINLRLSHHPDIHSNMADDNVNREYVKKLKNKLFVFDENNGREDKMQCLVFNTIDGDGTTRSCSVSSDAGSATYQGAMYSGAKKSGDALNTVSDPDNPPEPTRKEKYDEAVAGLDDLRRKMAISGFGGPHVKTMEEFNNVFKMGDKDDSDIDSFPYPGLSMDLEIDGIFGINPMCGIMSTHCSPLYFKKFTYFYVKSVTHKLDAAQSDWTTSVEGQFTYHKGINYIYL